MPRNIVGAPQQSGFNINPAPQSGSGAFGAVPGAIGLPSPFSDLSHVYPNLSGTNAAVSSSILSKLNGELSPTTVNAIQDNAARFGVASGMPGSGLSQNLGLRDLGLTSENLQQQGLQDYASLIPAISGTQTVKPETQIDVADRNSVYAAAPNPQQAQSYAQTLFDKYLHGLSGGSSNSGNWWENPSQTRKETFTSGLNAPVDNGPWYNG